MEDPSVAGARFDEYVVRLGQAVGHADRRGPLRAYLTGLLLPGDRKSVEPMAARVDPRHASARHQSMHHFVASAAWDDHEVLGIAVDHALLQMERHAPVGAWVVDDTEFPKKGSHSVGVWHQYCGALGKEENCQAVVTVSLVNATMSMPAAYRLYLPQAWAEDRARRTEAGVPEEVVFRTKWQLALEEIGRLLAEGLPPAPVVADSGYGDIHAFREGLGALGLSYAVAVKPLTRLWPPGTGPLLPTQRLRGRPAGWVAMPSTGRTPRATSPSPWRRRSGGRCTGGTARRGA
jgi:SRSO17 transposase